MHPKSGHNLQERHQFWPKSFMVFVPPDGGRRDDGITHEQVDELQHGVVQGRRE